MFELECIHELILFQVIKFSELTSLYLDKDI